MFRESACNSSAPEFLPGDELSLDLSKDQAECFPGFIGSRPNSFFDLERECHQAREHNWGQIYLLLSRPEYARFQTCPDNHA